MSSLLKIFHIRYFSKALLILAIVVSSPSRSHDEHSPALFETPNDRNHVNQFGMEFENINPYMATIIRAYTGGAYRYVNLALRESVLWNNKRILPEAPSEDAQEVLQYFSENYGASKNHYHWEYMKVYDQLNSLFQREDGRKVTSDLADNEFLWRGDKNINRYHKAEMGRIYSELAFASTSASASAATRFTKDYDIEGHPITGYLTKIRGATNALSVAMLSESPHEEEVLLAPNQIFQIHSKDPNCVFHEESQRYIPCLIIDIRRFESLNEEEQRTLLAFQHKKNNDNMRKHSFQDEEGNLNLDRLEEAETAHDRFFGHESLLKVSHEEILRE